MSNGIQKDTNGAQRQTLADSIDSIRSAELLLKQESRATSDPTISQNLSEAYNLLDALLSQLLNAQAISDDAEFSKAIPALKQQAAMLKAKEDEIKKLVSRVGTAAQIAGYVAQALALIFKLA